MLVDYTVSNIHVYFEVYSSGRRNGRTYHSSFQDLEGTNMQGEELKGRGCNWKRSSDRV